MIFFIVSCRSISYMAVRFNLYSLGYSLKRFIEHYPKLNRIYSPLTQLLKWSTSIWLWASFLLPFASPLMSHRSVLSSEVPPFPSHSARKQQLYKGRSLDLRNPSFPSKPSLLQQFSSTKNACSACCVIGLGEEPFVALPSEWIC